MQKLGWKLFAMVPALSACFSWAADQPLKPAQAKLAVEAHQILVAHCGKCHGKGGSYSDDMLLNYDQLVEEAFIVKGESGESDLYGEIADGSMPPKKAKNPVAAKDLAVIKKWIDEGAPNWNLAPQQKREFVSMESVIESIVLDLKKVRNRDRQFVRYYTLTHLYNAGETEDALGNYRIALSKLVNSLSWERDIVNPVTIDKNKTVLRLDLRDYGWDKAIWRKITELYPYAINYPYKSYEELCSLATAEIPFLRADWFISTAALPPLYHEILDLPDTDLALEKKLNVDVNRNLRDSPGRRVWRSGFLKSGVSKFNRIVERHTSPYGAYWKSYDFDSNRGQKNIFQNPLGFEHAGGEIIFNLPNGLQAYLLAESNGKRIDEAPVNIVFSTQGNDPIIRNGLSCMACHTAGMKEFKDRTEELRLAIQTTEFDDASEKEYALALYTDANTMNRMVQKDIDVFGRAVSELGGVIGGREPIALLTDRYEEALEAKHTAAEVGLPENEFIKKLRNHELLKGTGLNTLAAGGSVARETWEELFPLVVTSLGAGDPRFNKDQFKKFNDSLSADDRRKWIEETLKGGANEPEKRMNIPIEEYLKLREQLEESLKEQEKILKQISNLQNELKNAKNDAERQLLDQKLRNARNNLEEEQKFASGRGMSNASRQSMAEAARARASSRNIPSGSNRLPTLNLNPVTGRNVGGMGVSPVQGEAIRSDGSFLPDIARAHERRYEITESALTQAALNGSRVQMSRLSNSRNFINFLIRLDFEFKRSLISSRSNLSTILFETEEIIGGKKISYVYALAHTSETPFKLDEKSSGLRSAQGSVSAGNGALQPLPQVRFLENDPRVVLFPIGPADSPKVKAVGIKPYKLASNPFKFPKAFIMSKNGRKYGEMDFKIDPANPGYVKVDRIFFNFGGRFYPAKGDLVFSQTGDLIGIMTSNKYCHIIRNTNPAYGITFGSELNARAIALGLSRMKSIINAKPFALQ